MARLLQVALVLVAVACAGGVIWTATRTEIVSDTRCGPVFTQGNRRRAVCDDFYASHYLRTGVLAGAGVAAYAGSSIAERVEDRRSGRGRVR